MRVQRTEKRLHLFGFRFSQRRKDQRDAIRANSGAEPAGHGDDDQEFEEMIDARLRML